MSKSLLKYSLYSLLALLGIYVAYRAYLMLQGGEDRPPIIVSDGSVEFKAQPDKSGNRGKFVPIGTDGTRWYHDHPNHGPKWFTVTLTGTSNCPSTAYTKIDEITETYGPANGTADIQVRSARTELQFTDPATLVSDYLLRIPDPKGPVLHVDLFQKQGSTNNKVASCDAASGQHLTLQLGQAQK